MVTADVVAGDEKLVRAEFGRTVEIDGRGGLVGGKCDDFVDPGVDARFDEVLRAKDVGLDAFERVVFGGRHLLECCGVDGDVDAFKRAGDTVRIADIADEIADLGELFDRELLRHFKLLELVAGENHQSLDTGILGEKAADEALAERTGCAGDEDRLAV